MHSRRTPSFWPRPSAGTPPWRWPTLTCTTARSPSPIRRGRRWTTAPSSNRPRASSWPNAGVPPRKRSPPWRRCRRTVTARCAMSPRPWSPTLCGRPSAEPIAAPTKGGSVTTQSQRPAAPYAKAQDPLAACLIGLAGTPDDSSWIGSQLVTIAHLSADLIEPVHYASITAYRDERFTTVATSSPVVLAVDQAQYSAQAGPCLDALDTGSPIAVPDVAATATWPAFRYSALRLGIRASLSIPLFAGRGTAVAGLNLHGRNPATMAPLTAAVRAAYDPDDDGASPRRRGLDDGGSALVAGIAG